MGDYAISRNECQGQALRARDAIVWVEEGARPAALPQWAEERHLVLRCTVDGSRKDATFPPSSPDWKVASDEIEALLARAREQTLRDETDAAKTTLARAEDLVFGHPSLPNAMWLLNEVRLALGSVSGHETTHDDAMAHGLFRPSDTVWLNSVPSAASLYLDAKKDAAANERAMDTLTFRDQTFPLHLRIERRGVEIAAAWIKGPAAAEHSAPKPISFAAPEFACTRYDFANAGGAYCPRWVRVRKEYVSLCTYDRCGTETRLRDQAISWWMWTLAGATVTTGIVVAFASSGAFDSAPREVTIRPNGFLDR